MKMQVFRQICVWLLLVGSHTLVAQHLEPWIRGEMPPTRGNYEWRVASGADRMEALRDFQFFLGQFMGCVPTIQIVTEQFMDQANPEREQIDAVRIEGLTECVGREVWALRAREVVTTDPATGRPRTFHLYQYSTVGEFRPHHLNYRLMPTYSRSRANALSFVPFGAAQFYKGNRGMGAFFLTTQAVALASAGITWRLSENFHTEFLRERNPAQREHYRRQSETMETMFFVSLGVAGGLYVFQVLHGLFSDGNRREYRLAMAPFSAQQGSGLALSLRF